MSRDQVVGALLGGALGDAWGGAYEGQEGPVTLAAPKELWLSDDTQLTLATCEAIVEAGRLEPERIAKAFADLYRVGGLRGLGSSTLKAMRDLSAGVHWALAGARGEYAAGNGAAMRTAPLAFLIDPALEADRVVLRDVCRITHHHDEAYVGALAVVIAVRAVLDGKWRDGGSFVELAAQGLPDSAVRDRLLELAAARLSPDEVADRFGSSGYVVESVPLALRCADEIRTRPLAEVLALTIRLGGDTDTNASIAGQIAGAVVGMSKVASEELGGLDGLGDVVKVAERFAWFVTGTGEGS